MRFVHKALFGVVTLAMPALLSAQKLTPGQWTGTISPPNGPSLNATFDVRMAGDTTRITAKADGRELNFTEVKVEATRLLFTFTAGATVKCTLLRKDDKSFSGDCLDEGGSKGVIVMVPPKA